MKLDIRFLKMQHENNNPGYITFVGNPSVLEINGWSIICPTRASSRNLAKFIESVNINSHFKHEFIIVCDVFTTWQTIKLLQEQNRYYYRVDMANFYDGCNFGSTKATREYICFVQDDCIVSPGWDLNASKYLDHKTYFTPHMLQCWQVNNDFGMSRHPTGQVEDFNIQLFNNYCQSIMKDEVNENLVCAHPIILAKDLFELVGGFSIFTQDEGQHTHHEHGLKVRVGRAGGKAIGSRNSYTCHVPNTGRDPGLYYGRYRVNMGRRDLNIDKTIMDCHYPIICNKCGAETPGRSIPEKEGLAAIYLEYLCPKCR